MHVYRVTHRREKFLMVLQLLGLIHFHKRGKIKTPGGGKKKLKPVQRDKETSRDLHENITPKDKGKIHEISYRDTNDIKNHQSGK